MLRSNKPDSRSWPSRESLRNVINRALSAVHGPRNFHPELPRRRFCHRNTRCKKRFFTQPRPASGNETRECGEMRRIHFGYLIKETAIPVITGVFNVRRDINAASGRAFMKSAGIFFKHNAALFSAKRNYWAIELIAAMRRADGKKTNQWSDFISGSRPVSRAVLTAERRISGVTGLAWIVWPSSRRTRTRGYPVTIT